MADAPRPWHLGVAAAAGLGAILVGARALPDPVRTDVVAACEGRVAEAREGARVEIRSSRDDRTPFEIEEWGPSGPAGDTLHEVSVAYEWRGPDGAGGSDTARCRYVERAADAGFDPSGLRFEDAQAATDP